VPKTPNATCAPAYWNYQEIRPLLLESGELIGAKEAIRRVLVLENPRCADSHRLPPRCTPDCS
jgi:gentisate 1,2-dioxygenase